MAEDRTLIVGRSAYADLDGAVGDVAARCQIVSALFGAARAEDGTISERYANLLSIAIHDAREASGRAEKAYGALAQQGGAHG